MFALIQNKITIKYNFSIKVHKYESGLNKKSQKFYTIPVE